jgi:hypothetical protein
MRAKGDVGAWYGKVCITDMGAYLFYCLFVGVEFIIARL